MSDILNSINLIPLMRPDEVKAYPCKIVNLKVKVSDHGNEVAFLFENEFPGNWQDEIENCAKFLSDAKNIGLMSRTLKHVYFEAEILINGKPAFLKDCGSQQNKNHRFKLENVVLNDHEMEYMFKNVCLPSWQSLKGFMMCGLKNPSFQVEGIYPVSLNALQSEMSFGKI